MTLFQLLSELKHDGLFVSITPFFNKESNIDGYTVQLDNDTRSLSYSWNTRSMPELEVVAQIVRLADLLDVDKDWGRVYS